MVNCTVLTEHTGCFDRIAAHPEQVGRIKVHADHRADSLTQTEQRFRVVNQLHTVVFERNPLDSAILCQLNELFPCGNRNLIPLVIQNVLRLGRPRGRDPHRRFIALAADRQTAHHNDLLYSELMRQLKGFLCYIHVLFIRERVARAVERAQLQTLLTHGIVPFFAGGLVAYQKVEVTVRRTRPVAGADFNGGNFLLHAEIEHLLIGHIQRAGFDSKLHCHIPSLIRIR